MFRNYFKILLRFLLKQKGFSVINVLGLTIGIACSLLILLYVQDELTYDRFHKDADRIFRVGFSGNIQGARAESAQTGLPLAEAIQRIDGVQSTIRLASWGTFPVKYEDKTFTEKHLLLADANFFTFFSFNLIAGNPDSVLFGKGKAVITESAAKRYFNYSGRGDASPIGKTLVFAQGYQVTVTGIAEDPPLNAHFHFTLLLSLKSWEAEKEEREDWISGRVFTYYKLFPDAPVARTESKVKDDLGSHLSSQLEDLRNTNLEAFKKQGNDLRYFIQPLREIHLKSNLGDEMEANGSMVNIILFSCIALFITLLACINFMNLTTAQSTSRAKEVAVRKSVGANQDLLIGQFLLESYFYVVVGVIHALAIIAIVLVPFNYFTEKQIELSRLLNPEFILGLLIFITVTGLVAGSYPAFYLTNFNPVEVLKGNLRARVRSYGIRNVLVVFQFFISASLIIATLVVYYQLQFIQKVNLGFDKSNVINLLHTLNLGDRSGAFKEALLQEPSVVSASYCSRVPPNIQNKSVFRTLDGGKDFLLAIYEMDEDHLETMRYKMVAGRFFKKNNPQDIHSVILNETAARKLGLLDYKGKKLLTDNDFPLKTEREVIGIMQDFNFTSLKDPIEPMAVLLGLQPNWEMAIRLKEGNTDSTLARVGKIWKEYAPDAAFEYSFVDKNFDSKQRTEKRIGLLFMTFTALAIIIACMGLFGLATFSTEQKRKQIGIRKVLGASIRNIVILLNKDFLKLVLIANLLAWPSTWWLMRKWLDQFAYHTGIAWWIFAITGAITFLIAFLSISFRSFRAAAGNPVISLRNE
ncbi:MAG: ABC transporter permease [Cyclobacteriaceae bacterium]